MSSQTHKELKRSVEKGLLYLFSVSCFELFKIFEVENQITL